MELSMTPVKGLARMKKAAAVGVNGKQLLKLNPNGVPKTMEETNLILPLIKDTIIGLGDLWDCRTSTSPGNIFSKPFERKHLEALPMQTLEYHLYKIKDTKNRMTALNISASVSLDLMNGMIKVSGSAQYDNEDTKKFNKEELICKYDCSTFVVRVRQGEVGDIIDEAVRRRLKNEEIRATHYVQSVRIGGQVEGVIRISEKIDKNHMNVGGSFKGSITIGPISASAELSLKMLDDVYSEDVETEVFVSASPRLAKSPTNVAEMFEGISKVDSRLAEEKHFQQIGPEVVGVPLSFKLVPISYLFEELVTDNKFKLMEDDIMNNFTDMIFTCQDFQQPNHIKGLIREKEYRLAPILMDESNPFTMKISTMERFRDAIAKKYKKEAFEIYARFKEDLAKVEDISDLVDRYDKEFNLVELGFEIQELVKEGRRELTGIHAGDVVSLRDEEKNATVTFISNEEDFNDWWTPERTIKVWLQTSTEKGESPSGTFLKLFNLSAPLLKLGVQVGVSFPNISKDFSLTVKIHDKIVKYTERDITFALEVLGVAIEKWDLMSTLFYRLTGVLTGLNLLSVEENLADIKSLVNIFKESREIVICETYPQIVENLLDTEGVWNFVLPLQALNTSYETMKFFRQMKVKLAEEYPRVIHRWIIGRFNITHYDSPLLLVFRDNELKAICLDHLDILILLNQFRHSSKSPDLSILSHENLKNHCIYPSRANFAVKVLEGLVLDHSTTLLDIVPPIPEFEHPTEDDELFKVMSVTRTAAVRIEIDVLNTVAWFAIADLSDLRYKLEKHGWTDEGFLSVGAGTDWSAALGDLKKFLGDQAPYLVKVEGAIKSLLALKPPEEPEPEEPDPEKQDLEEHDSDKPLVSNSLSRISIKITGLKQLVKEPPEDNRREKVKEIIKFITDFEESGNLPESNLNAPRVYRSKGKIIDEEEKFKDLKAEIDTFVKCEDVEVIIRGIVNAMEAFYNEETLGSTEFFNLLQLTLLVEGLASKEESFKHLLIDVVKKYCQRTELIKNVYPKYPGALKKITDAISERNLFKALGILASLKQDPLIYGFTEDIYNLKNLTNVEHTKLIVENMRKRQFTDKQLQAIWLNPKFVFLIRQGIENEALVETLFVELCIDHVYPENEDSIPRFIPKDIADKLLPLVYQPDEPQFNWAKDWNDVHTVVQVFQTLVTRKFIPKKFSAVLRKNMEENVPLKSLLEECKALFYWNKEEFYFTEPWSLNTISEALGRLMASKVTEESFHAKFPLVKIGTNTSSPQTDAPKVIKNLAVTDDWKRFTIGGQVNRLTIEMLSFIIDVHQKPFIEYDELSKTLGEILPYLVQQAKMHNPISMQANYVSKYIKYPPTDGVKKPGHIDFDIVKVKEEDRFLMSRGDLLTVLFNCADELVTHNVLLSMMKAPLALPMIIPGIITGGDTYKFLIPALQNLIVSELANVVPQPHLLTSPFRLVLTLRVGDVGGKLGRSSILNQLLMGHRNMFSCFAEPGAEHGKPIARPGLLEFTWLAPHTMTPEFYDAVAKPHYKSNQPDMVLLGNLHGDALNFGPLLELLKTFTSSFLVFWKANNWNDLKAKRTQLGRFIGNGSSILDLVLYPDSTISSHVGPQNIIGVETPVEIEASTKKLYSAFADAVSSKPKVPVPLGISSLDMETISPELDAGILNFIQQCRPKSSIAVNPTQFKIPEIGEENISTKESHMLISFIRDETVQRVKEALMTVSEKDEIFLTQLVSLTISLLALPLEKRNMALTHFMYELDYLSSTSSRSAVDRIVKLRKELIYELGIGQFDDQQFLELQDEAKAVLTRLERKILTIHDIFRYLMNVDEFQETYFEYLKSGFPVELFQPTHGDVMWSESMALAINSIPNDTRIFVISVIGLKAAGKSTLLNRLFGYGFREGPAGCTTGLHMRFLWVDKAFQKSFKCDAICVIDCEGFSAPENCIDENADQHERNMAAFVLGISHLTLANVFGFKMAEMMDIFESSFTTLSRVNDLLLTPDVLLVQQLRVEDEPDPKVKMGNSDGHIRREWKEFMDNVKGLTKENEIQLGVRHNSAYRMETVKSRDKHGELIHTIRPWRENQELNSLEYHADIQDLLRKILTICKSSHQVTMLGDWYEFTALFWKNIKTLDVPNTPASSKLRNVAQMQEAIRLKVNETDVKRAIDLAFRSHDKKVIEGPFLEEIEEFFDKPPALADILADPGLALDKVHSKLKVVVNTCDIEDGTPCLECLKAFNLRETLFENIVTKKRAFVTVDAITAYHNQVRESLWSRYRQHVVAMAIKHGKSKELENILDKILEDHPDNMAVAWLKFKQHLSTVESVIQAGQCIVAEAIDEYATLSHVISRLGPQHRLPDLENMTAFDLGYYNKAVESAVNSPKSETLTWNQNDWLVAKIEDIPVGLLTDNDSNIYLVGMVGELKIKMEEILREFTTVCGEQLLPNFKWEAHLYAIKIFKSFMEKKQQEWDNKYNPIAQLEKRKDVFPDIFENY